MSCDPQASLFFGYVWPEKDWEDKSDTPDQPFPEDVDTWSLETDEVVVGIHGADGCLRRFIAAKASLVEVEWAEFKRVSPRAPSVEDAWCDLLDDFVDKTGADIEGAHGPDWFLTVLYF